MTLRRLATATTALIFLQILIGAAMRHTGAGLAIPDFPWMFGHVVPDHWNGRIAVHFTHRLGALIVTLGIGTLSAYVWSHHRGRRELTQPATLIVALVAMQVTLGALTVLTRREIWINSLHVVCGALVLTTSLVLTLRSWRARFAEVRLKPDTTDITVRLKPDTTGNTIRLKPDTTGHTIRLKPDTTGHTIRLKPDATDITVRLKPDTTGNTIRLKPGTTDITVRLEPDTTNIGSVRLQADRRGRA